MMNSFSLTQPSIPTTHSDWRVALLHWSWLFWQRLKHHAQGRIALVLISISLLAGVMTRLQHGRIDTFMLLYYAIAICYFPANQFMQLCHEISNMPSSRTWSKQLLGGWLLFAGLGAVMVAIFSWITSSALPLPVSVPLGILFYLGGLSPNVLLLLYFIAICLGLSPLPISDYIVEASLGMGILAVLLGTHGVYSIRACWIDDYRFRDIRPSKIPIWMSGYGTRNNAPGWQHGTITASGTGIARALLFETESLRHSLLRRWALVTCVCFVLASVSLPCIGYFTSSNGKADLQSGLTVGLLYGVLITILALCFLLPTGIPNGRLLPVARNLYIRAVWLAHLMRGLLFIMLLGCLALTYITICSMLRMPLHNLPTGRLALAALVLIISLLCYAQAGAIKRLSINVFTAHWNMPFFTALLRIVGMLALMLALGIVITLILMTGLIWAFLITVGAILASEIWLIWRIRRHFQHADLILR